MEYKYSEILILPPSLSRLELIDIIVTEAIIWGNAYSWKHCGRSFKSLSFRMLCFLIITGTVLITFHFNGFEMNFDGAKPGAGVSACARPNHNIR